MSKLDALGPKGKMTFEEKCAMIALRSIGKRVRVRTDPGPSKAFQTIVEGDIIAAELHRTRRTPRSLVAVFKVTIAAGYNKVPRIVYISKLPQ